MLESVEIVLKKSLNLKKREKLLIITDSKLHSISKIFYQQGKKITSDVRLITIPIPAIQGMEPGEEIAREMLNYDVELLITTKSLSHTKARKDACNNGARIVTMPGITKDVLQRTLNIDYNKLKKIHNELADILDKGKKVAIKTKLGTNINFDIKNRKAYGRSAGIFNGKGDFGNLPAGEVFIAPVEETANGVFVVDASFASIGKLKTPLKIFVEKGSAVEFSGYKSKNLEKLLDSVGSEARNIAEFGIGTNEKATVTGNILEDEKVLGTCHIALGNNTGFGGKVNVQLHLDGIIRNPTIWVDTEKIMYNGKFTKRYLNVETTHSK